MRVCEGEGREEGRGCEGGGVRSEGGGGVKVKVGV